MKPVYYIISPGGPKSLPVIVALRPIAYSVGLIFGSICEARQ